MGPDIVSALRAAGCVFAEDEANLLLEAATVARPLSVLMAERTSGIPLEHVLGWAEFYGLRITVDRGVFVPRRRTELLVQEAIALTSPGAVVVDLCCGSGAVGVALADGVPGIELHAADVELAAVSCARRNLAPWAARVYEGDLYAALPPDIQGRVDVVVANVPYVPTERIALMPMEARLHEPAVALDGGGDGLQVLRRVAADAPRWLAPGGHLLIETSEQQAPAAREAFACAGLVARIAQCDELAATVVIGARSGGE